MSLAYGVKGEIILELESNYGDWADWTKDDLMRNIDRTIKNILTFADNPKERKQLKAILKSKPAKLKIAREFVNDEEKKPYFTKMGRI